MVGLKVGIDAMSLLTPNFSLNTDYGRIERLPSTAGFDVT